MAMSKTLVWVLAGGAALALGGAAIWLWRRRRSEAPKLDDEKPPEPDGMPLPDIKPENLRVSVADDTVARTATAASASAQAAETSTPSEQEPAVIEHEPAESPADQPAVEAVPEPPTILIPKQRRKRYPIGPGDLIELHARRVPSDASFGASRPDVEVRVVEQDDSWALVALDGPVGDVNVALLREGPKGPRPITSWKFEIVGKDKVA